MYARIVYLLPAEKNIYRLQMYFNFTRQKKMLTLKEQFFRNYNHHTGSGQRNCSPLLVVCVRTGPWIGSSTRSSGCLYQGHRRQRQHTTNVTSCVLYGGEGEF